MTEFIVTATHRSSAEVTGDLDPDRVLIVEDEPGICNAVALTLRHAGFRTLELSGVGGLAAAIETKPFLIILDLGLDNSDAVDVLEVLASRGFAGAVQLVSGNSRNLLEEIRGVGIQRGLAMLPVLPKPFRMREIRRVAYEAAHRRASQSASTASIVPNRTVLQVSLAEALTKEWLECWYQPKYDLQTRLLVGAECLARIKHPVFGNVLPESFLPDARPQELEALTLFMLRRACADWHFFKSANRPMRLAVNLASGQLTEMPLAQILRDCAPDDQDWPGLILEITEDQVLDDVARASVFASQLKSQGVELSIDDFGYGHANLSRLREIPFRELKLDLGLVRGCAAEKEQEAKCRAAVELGHALGAVVAAEGVETAADLNCLTAMGCDLAQGFLLGRPMPAEALAGRLGNGGRAGVPLGAPGKVIGPFRDMGLQTFSVPEATEPAASGPSFIGGAKVSLA